MNLSTSPTTFHSWKYLQKHFCVSAQVPFNLFNLKSLTLGKVIKFQAKKKMKEIFSAFLMLSNVKMGQM